MKKIIGFILFFVALHCNNAAAQQDYFVQHYVNALNNESEVQWYVHANTFYGRQLVLKVAYEKNGTVIKQMEHNLAIEKKQFYGKYWQQGFAHRLADGQYNVRTTIVDTFGTLLYSSIDSLVLNSKHTLTTLLPLQVLAIDSGFKYPLQLIDNFCDTFTQQLQVVTQVVGLPSKKEPIKLCYQLCKHKRYNNALMNYCDSINYNSGSAVLKNKFGINLSQLRNGNYDIICTAKLGNEEIGKQIVTIQILRPIAALTSNPKTAVDSNTKAAQKLEGSFVYKGTFVEKYSFEVLSRNAMAMKAITSAVQYKVMRQLIDAGNDSLLRNFFYNYWLEKEPTKPEAAWKQYAALLNDCTKSFGAISSDRAMVYLRYGKPDKQEDVPNEVNTIPYEIWQYNVIGDYQNVVFLFVTNSNALVNDKMLLHSTMPTERQYSDWRSFLIRGEDNGNRVFEYLQLNGNSK